MTYYHFSKVYYEGEDKLFSQTVTLANGSMLSAPSFYYPSNDSNSIETFQLRQTCKRVGLL